MQAPEEKCERSGYGEKQVAWEVFGEKDKRHQKLFYQKLKGKRETVIEVQDRYGKVLTNDMEIKQRW